MSKEIENVLENSRKKDELLAMAEGEADKIAVEMDKVITGLVKLEELFSQVTLLAARNNFTKLPTKAPAFQISAGRIISKTLGVLASIAQTTSNKKCFDLLNKAEIKTKWKRQD